MFQMQMLCVYNFKDLRFVAFFNVHVCFIYYEFCDFIIVLFMMINLFTLSCLMNSSFIYITFHYCFLFFFNPIIIIVIFAFR